MANDKTSELVLAYYESWKNGMASYDETRLRAILAPDLKFEGPLAGKRNSADAFLSGLAGFVKAVKAVRILQKVHAGNEAAVFYECDLTMPAGTFRFAEFLRVDKDTIQEINLVFDATEFRKLIAR
jgi:SnoaL-like domain